MAINLNKDVVYKSAKAKEKDYTISDGGGLVLLIKSTGSKLWRFIYRFDGKQNRLGLGVYPDTTLENARRQAEEARKQIAEGTDPGEIKRQDKAAKQLAKQNEERIDEGLPIKNSFADIAYQWLNSIAHRTSSTTHKKNQAGLSGWPSHC